MKNKIDVLGKLMPKVDVIDFQGDSVEVEVLGNMFTRELTQSLQIG